MFGRVMAKVRSLITRRRAEGELDEELRFHVDMETQAHVRAGMSSAAARRAALAGSRRHGADAGSRAGRAGDDLRPPGTGRPLCAPPDAPGAGLRRGGDRHDWTGGRLGDDGLFRGRVRSSQALPYGDPARIVMVWKTNQNIDFFPLPVPELLDIKNRARSVQEIGGLDREGFTLVGSRTTEWVDAFRVTANLFDVLDVHAILGRTFAPDDGLPGREHVAVIGEALWRRVFGSIRASSAGGSSWTRRARKRPFPRRTKWSESSPPTSSCSIPRTSAPNSTSHESCLPVTARRARARCRRCSHSPGPGRAFGLSEAAAEIRSVLAASTREHPKVSLPGAGTRVVPLHEELVGRTRPVFLLLAAAAGVLLLIGCVNVANLLLAGGMRRAPELAARLALGCSRARLLQQLLTEHLLLACGGGVLGALLAAGATPALKRFAPASLPRVDQIHVDAAGFAFALATALIAGLVFGLAPAVMLARPRLAAVLKTRSGTATSAGGRLRHILVVVETALVLALLACAR